VGALGRRLEGVRSGGRGGWLIDRSDACAKAGVLNCDEVG
jgi:hypothetical protein